MLERLQQLLGRAFARRPAERQPLHAVRVGVLRRREAAAVERELALQVVERRVGDRAVARLVEAARGVQVDGREQRVVVEHLLEVRHEPALVDRVAVEAAADEVVHAAERHPVERAARHLLLAAAEEELEHRRGRELRRPPPAAPLRVEALAERALRVGEQRVGERLARRRQVRARADVLGQVALDVSTSLRWSRHASATPSSTCLNEGSPCRGSGGK